MQRLKIKKGVLLTLTVSIMIFLFCVSVFAADFPRRLDSEKRSEKEGLGKKEISLLLRMPGPGKEAVSKNLIAKFRNSKTAVTTRGLSRSETKGKTISVINADWFLDVKEDGSNVRYRNYGYLESKKDLAKPVAQRLSNEKLEALGRKFISDNLSEYIKLGKNEEIVPVFTEHAIGFAGEAKEGISRYEEKVYASTIVYTRKVNKIEIIGPGSKIAVMFNNAGTPVGFDYDWPQYKMTGKMQKVLPVEDIKSRAKKLAPIHLDVPDVKIKRFNCGLYDAGARHHDPKSVVQSACVVKSYQKKIIDKKANERDQQSGHITSAHIDYIPAGEVVENDVKWHHAIKLLDLKERPGLSEPPDGPKHP
jgi:hypothetical protein